MDDFTQPLPKEKVMPEENGHKQKEENEEREMEEVESSHQLKSKENTAAANEPPVPPPALNYNPPSFGAASNILMLWRS